MSSSAMPSPPFDLEVEKCILGSVLRDPNCMPDVSAVVWAEDFYSPRHRELFKIMIELEGQNPGQCDPLTLGHEVQRRKKEQELGGAEYLGECMLAVPSNAFLENHLTIVRNLSIRRSLLKASEEIQTNVFDGEYSDVDELVGQAEKAVFNVGERLVGKEMISVSELIDENLDNLLSGKAKEEGLKTGYYDLDEKSAFRPGDLVVLAARPGMGKTAFALNLLERVAVQDKKAVLMFSLEMPRDQLVVRLLSSLGRVSHDNLRRNRLQPADKSKLATAGSMLRDTVIHVDDSSQPSLSQIRAKARRLKREGKLDLLIIDYLQLLQAKAESRQNEVSLISRTLKSIARDLEVPVLALAQLNRKAEDRTDHKPMLSDLRESGSIEQDADMVMMLMREDYYNETDENRDKAMLSIAKNRHGSTGEIHLKFNKRFMRFENNDAHAQTVAPTASATAFDDV
ncbi:MAG: replicative DNA helicase [Myxococcota bacterium]|jgi:replicative DNA helicase